MDFQTLLAGKKQQILYQWHDVLLSLYPDESKAKIKNVVDPFANPIGNTLNHFLMDFFEWLAGERDEKDLTEILDRLVRIKAVQSQEPSAAIGFFIQFKKIVKKQFEEDGTTDQAYQSLDFLLEKLDKAQLKAFDIYVSCREKIYEIKLNEAGRKTYMLRRLNEGKTSA